MASEELLLRIQVEGADTAAVKVERLEQGIGRTSNKAKEAEKSMGMFSRGRKGMARGFGMVASTVGVAGVGLGLAEAIKSAEQFQDVQKQLGVAVKAAGLDMREGTKRLTEYSEALSVRGGFTAPENLQSLTTFIRITKNVTKAQQMLSLATNIARGTHKSLSASTRAVMMAESGRLSGLTRLGIILPKNATATKALSILQDRYAGSTKAYSETAAGAMSDFTHTVEQLGEKLGAKLIPPLTTAFKFLNRLVDQFEHGKGLGGQIRIVFEHIGDALKGIWEWLKKVEFDHLGGQLKTVWKWAKEAYKGLMDLVDAFRKGRAWAVAIGAAVGGLIAYKLAVQGIAIATEGWAKAQALLDAAMDMSVLGLVIAGVVALGIAFYEAYKHVGWFRDLVNAVFKWLKGAVSDVIGFISKHWKLLFEIFGGPVAWIILHWKGLISFFKSVPGAIVGVFKGIGDAISGIFEGAVRGIVSAINWVIKQLDKLHIHIPSIGPIGGGDIGFNIAPLGMPFSKPKPTVSHSLPGHAHALGGMIFGEGHRDTIPFLGKPGEYVATDRMVKEVGSSAMDAWRAGGPPPGPQAVFEGAIHLHMDGKQVGMALVRQGLQQKALA